MWRAPVSDRIGNLRQGCPLERLRRAGQDAHRVLGTTHLQLVSPVLDRLVRAVEEKRRALSAASTKVEVANSARCRARFFRAQRGDFDLVVAMYHDQGHGPVKVLGIEEGVNVTVGLPVIRTSVDHETAFDIAGTGRADERSMLSAIRQAIALSPERD